ncbi:unnamed protein product [Acanthoscelides obtectus]|uniref:Uncharacterized protein n=1 Tax=Acanthoscelides obtectus TaxID=200917 RepID=A0A9P0PIP5_ACAOB|nr:unnamed protein product [Acanthoscelides obtectus]CAK1634404.1 hypothetical protein AOBTE_LOCUS8746 [Acanthoscelides obtectus]
MCLKKLLDPCQFPFCKTSSNGMLSLKRDVATAERVLPAPPSIPADFNAVRTHPAITDRDAGPIFPRVVMNS